MTERLIDLHCHSTCSDGTLTPEQLADHAARLELAAVALTDHDNYNGWEEFRQGCLARNVEPVEGVEISALWENAPERPRTLDILGYLFDPSNEELGEKLAWMRRVRKDRNGMILEKLEALGMPIAREELAAEAGSDVIGRPHFAKVMIRKGYCTDWRECFDEYLGDHAKAWVPKARMSPAEAIGLIRRAGGIPVLAHPYALPLEKPQEYRALLEELADAGLQGLECDYPDHTAEQRHMFRGLAAEFGLVATGGSDFHGGNRPQCELGRGYGALRVPYEVLENLRSVKPLAAS